MQSHRTTYELVQRMWSPSQDSLYDGSGTDFQRDGSDPFSLRLVMWVMVYNSSTQPK